MFRSSRSKYCTCLIILGYIRVHRARRNSLHTRHVIPSSAHCIRNARTRGGTLYFYFHTNPSLLIKWRLENNLTSLMSGHEFYCYCILIKISLFDGSSIPFRVRKEVGFLFSKVLYDWIIQTNKNGKVSFMLHFHN